MKDLNLQVVIALMDKYDIEDLASFIQSYAHLHVEKNEEMERERRCKASMEKSFSLEFLDQVEGFLGRELSPMDAEAVMDMFEEDAAAGKCRDVQYYAGMVEESDRI